MPELELPEAKDPFEKKIALAIAILAVILSVVENRGAGAKTEAIVKTNLASNQWAWYQSKALKGNLAESNVALLGVLSSTDANAAKAKAEEQKKEAERYKEEKKELQEKAEDLDKEAKHLLVVNEHCERSTLLLQIAVVLGSIAILVSWRPIFYASLLIGAVGTYFGVMAFLT